MTGETREKEIVELLQRIKTYVGWILAILLIPIIFTFLIFLLMIGLIGG